MLERLFNTSNKPAEVHPEEQLDYDERAAIRNIENAFNRFDFQWLDELEPKQITAALQKRLSLLPTSDTRSVRNEKGIINGSNLIYGSRRPIQSPESSHYMPPAASLLCVAQHAVLDTQWVDLGSMITEGEPPKLPLIHPKYLSTITRAKQYAKDPLHERFHLPEKDVSRVIPVPKEYRSNFIYALSILDRIEQEIPDSISNSIHLMNKHDPLLNHRTAIGMLEAMHTVGIMDDERFTHVAKSLRSIIFREFSTYEELRKRFSYSVFSQSVFWIDGESEDTTKGQKGGHYRGKNKELGVPSEAKFTLRNLDTWNGAMRQIALASHEVQTLTNGKIITSGLVEHGMPTNDRQRKKISRHVHQEVAHRAELRHTITQSKKEIVRLYRRDYTADLESLGENSSQALERITNIAIEELAKVYASQPELSQKTKGYIQGIANPASLSAQASAYPVETHKLSQSPFFQWLGSLHNVKAREQLLAAMKQQPSEFAVLSRLMFSTWISETLLEDEDAFVFQSSEDFSEEDIRCAQNFFYNLCDRINQSSPKPEEIILSLPHNYLDRVSDLLTFQHHREIDERIELWKTRPFIWKQRLPHQITVARENVVYASAGIVFLIGMIGVIELAVSRPAPKEEGSVSHYTPDQLSREQLDQRDPTRFAKIFQLPAGIDFHVQINKLVIPTSIDDALGFTYRNGVLHDLQNVDQYIPGQPVIAAPDELVYMPATIDQTMYPPIGYRIVGVAQTGGERPLLTGSGEITWYDKALEDNRAITKKNIPGEVQRALPSEIVIKAVRTEKDPDPFQNKIDYRGVDIYRDVKTSEYYITNNFDEQEARKVNQALAGDPALQLLHRRMIDELEPYMEPNKFDANAVSELIVRYTSEFWMYVQTHRYYSLEMHEETLLYHEDPYYYLKAIAANPDSGYFCAFAARSLEGFWRSVGVPAIYQSVSPVTPYGDELWTDVGHVTTRIPLPNGMVAFTDTTPHPVVGKTPQKDMDVLQERGPADVHIPLTQRILNLSEQYGIPLSVALSLYAGLRNLYGWMDEKKLMRKYRQMLERNKEGKDLTPAEARLLASVSAYIGVSNFDDVEHFADQTYEALDLLKQVNVSEYNDLIHWVANLSLHDVNVNPEDDFFGSLEQNVTKIMNFMLDRWYSNRDGVRDVVPENLWNDIGSAIMQGNEVASLHKDLQLAITMGLFINYFEHRDVIDQVHQRIKGQIEQRKHAKKQQLIMKEKIAITQNLVIAHMRDVNLSKRNAKYLSTVIEMMGL